MARLYKRSRNIRGDSAPNRLCFLLNHELVEIDNVDPSLTVLEYLRTYKGLTGTKMGCAQGGCGSCTVTLGEMQGSGIQYQSVNSCICLLASLHNKHLITIEGIARNGKLHPAQQVLITSHASQCGFCMPGVVMSLYTLCYDHKANYTRQKICDVLNGNLCRCTGYRPIIAAAQKMLKRKNLNSYGYNQQQVLRRLKKTPYKQAQTFIHKSATYHSPTTSDEVAQLILKYTDATLVAGGTNLGVSVARQEKKLNRIIALERVKALKKIRKGKDMFAFGAGVTLNEAGIAIAQDYPDLGELIRRLGSQQLRNRATMIGHIATATASSDLPAALIVLDAKLTLRAGNYRRFLKLEDYFISAGKRDLKPGEFIESLQIPRAQWSFIYHVYKLSKRFDHDFSSICGAFFLKLDNENLVKDIRICYSGMDVLPKRAVHVESALAQEPWTIQSVNKIINIFEKDFQPPSDCRGTADYRMTAAKNLVKRFYLETQSGSIKTRLGDLTIG